MMPWIRKIHKWASVVVGIQFLLWLSSGIYFNLMDHQKAAGNTYRSHSKIEVKVAPQELLEPSIVLSDFPPSVELTTTSLLSKPIYQLTHKKGLYANFENSYTLVDAYTGRQILIDEDMANALAKESYSGPGTIRSTTLLHGLIDDFPKQKNPAWQVDFDDEVQTSVYIESGSGRIVGHSDEDKRLADIFFMLHFMDYTNEGSFNSVQMILFAFVTLWLSLSGFIWTIDLGFRGQYQLSWFAKKRKVKLFDRDRKSMGTLSFSTHVNLLDGLVEHNIILPSTCGGGGTCGRCKVMINPAVKSSSADELHFTKKELAEGFRLACQHFSNDIDHMTLMDVTNAQKHTMELTETRFISPFIKELKFKTKGRDSIVFKAGAFMRFFIPAAKSHSIPVNIPEAFKPDWQHVEERVFEHDACTRSYSCAMSCATTDELVFTIKFQPAPNDSVLPGIASHYLCNLQPGETVEALGPFEEFFVKQRSEKTMVLIGAGSGMAPLRAIIDEQIGISLQSFASNREIYFFYGARNENDLIYADDFYFLAEQNELFHYFPVLSKPDNNWLGAAGYVQHILQLNLDSLGDLSELEFYVCGPQGLMDEVISMLERKGVKSDDIRFDLFK
ncbi:2Fe-2S iron-sulfur cluster-binding protein [Aliiglaciecola lipolytica]|uniref:Na+-transporting NADH:ubiquinone oxidoreductase, subunit NqrF n=1 Tax=Aliiglaciecola lipolytica E3 TaxID=1127673 RepID=K6X8D0_9ALTE|nr:2Fe-2S iron-sulfur cluster-binding protein [Aliiglaciecola lipolytica]GAC16869.1 Na+-transporting NADH:ubiquinone oxidoreductase, subunit NqrF [Aliiglaciecola lipolytica E3]